jgi:hypothetical protein
VEAPELPRTILARKTVDDSFAAGMFVGEISAVVYDIVHNNPGTTETVFG